MWQIHSVASYLLVLVAVNEDVGQSLLPAVIVPTFSAAPGADPVAGHAAAELAEQDCLCHILQDYSTDPWFQMKANSHMLEVWGGMYTTVIIRLLYLMCLS